MGKFFNKYNAQNLKFYLDAPVSNSGNLKYRILEHAKTWGIDIHLKIRMIKQILN
ncbi:DUF5616 domain-containing protein [Clostridioides difficile]